MSTPDPLDDWTYSELVAEGLAILPAFAPEWTNFNASDPGITFLELFAYFTELLIFQIGQRTPEEHLAFLRLLSSRAPDLTSSTDDAITVVLRELRQPERAVTCEDFETLALRADTRVARARCVPLLNLEERTDAARRAIRPGHVSVVLTFIPGTDTDGIRAGLQRVKGFLEPRRTLSTRIHVVPARRVDFSVQLRILANPGVLAATALDDARLALTTFFNAVSGGPDGNGWPMGRHVFLSEIYLVVSRLGTVDFVIQQTAESTGVPVPELAVAPTEADRLYRDGNGDLIGLQLKPDELPGSVVLNLQAAASAVDESRNL